MPKISHNDSVTVFVHQSSLPKPKEILAVASHFNSVHSKINPGRLVQMSIETWVMVTFQCMYYKRQPRYHTIISLQESCSY